MMKPPYQPMLVVAGRIGAETATGIDGYSPNPFDALPIEMNQEISGYIQSDHDLDNVQCACKALCAAVTDPHFWRKRFLLHFDLPRPDSRIKAPEDFKQEYKRRQGVLKYGTHNGEGFLLGLRKREQVCLQTLRELALDACHGGTRLNVGHLGEFARTHYIVEGLFDPQKARSMAPRHDRNFRHQPSPLLLTLQLMMTPNILDLDRRRYAGNISHFRYPDSQMMAYSTAVGYPIFGGCNGLDINMEWCLHQMNFWRYHMLRAEECTLFEAYSALDNTERPRYWSSSLTNNDDAKIGTHWKGAYGFVSHDDIAVVRMGINDETMQIIDEFNSDEQNGDFQDLSFTLTDEKEQEFNPLFESILHSLERPVQKARTRAQKQCASPSSTPAKSRSFRFGGHGRDVEERFLADGWLNQLPEQHGIPGWQRMTMMKYFENEHGDLDTESLWAYEGVCLPGGQIIVGRWWSPTSTVNRAEDMYSGPFLLWCVDPQ